jgi:subtilisin family serine protease
MKPSAPLALVAFSLGACAPARTAPPPTTPAPAPTAPVRTGPVPDSAARNWQLLDLATDGFPGTGAARAYRELLAGKQPKRTVVVAVIDGGVDVGHEDLRDNVWTNAREVPGNGVDDDKNGYADDVHGWNFIGGKDGRDVEEDTYEVTRLYVHLSGRYARARADTLSPKAREEYALYQKVRTDFEQRRAENARMLQQMRQVEVAVDRFTAILKQALGTDSLTTERVRALQSSRPEVQQARQIYLQLAADGVTPAMIHENVEELQKRERYALNPEFNSRPIVGDDTLNVRERYYGNPDVKGPDAMHGTHVAGIIGAERNNGIGVDGIAPAVRLMGVRTVPDGDERDKDVANAIRYAVDNGANIINMSFGKSYSPQKEVVDEAVRYADQHGVLMVHAAGNDGADLAVEPNFPTRTYLSGGTAKNWIEVGASSWWGVDSLAAPFSNYGREQVDIFAPGVAILSTVPGNEYRRLEGTSMAAPVVTGVAALLMAYYPELSAEQVRQIILDSATRYPGLRVIRPGSEGTRVPFSDLSVTGGTVNAYEAVRLAEQRSH